MRIFIFCFIIVIIAAISIGNMEFKNTQEEMESELVADKDNTWDSDDNTEGMWLYDARGLRRLFENAPKETWKIAGERYAVEYPNFMMRSDMADSLSMHVFYHDISMKAVVFTDNYDMSLQEKYEGVNKSAFTKSINDSSFLMAGRLWDTMRYFEKYMLLEPRTWMYIRVEFPKGTTKAVDPLLHYVKDYEPHSLWFPLPKYEFDEQINMLTDFEKWKEKK